MRVRHKTPTLVSMWMLDVFCCALGCVTLLWLLNTRQAGDQTAAARSALTDLAQSRSSLKLALTSLDSTKLQLTSEVRQLTTQLAAVKIESDENARKLGIARDEAKSAEAQLDATKTALNAAEAKLEASATDLAFAREKLDAGEDALRKKRKEAELLAKKASAAATTADELQRLLRQKDEERLVLEKRTADAKQKLDDLDAKLASTRKEVAVATTATKVTAAKAMDELAASKASAAKAEAELLAARGQIKDLLKKADDNNATLIDLRGEKAKLADKVDKLDRSTENRFAGITITGKSVAFVVDMSGSMDKLDAQTAAPHKWPAVCETVAKVMRTVPTLERYQVVVFSKQARWLSGNGEWQKFEGEKSATAVKQALLRVRPEGDTNLHAAFDLTFSLRAQGLDTVYLFSDGLPTSGPGLSLAQENANPPLEETKRSELLSKYIRDKLRATWNRRLKGDDRVKVHAIGFFYESPEVGAFLWALARENDGSFVGMASP